MTVAIQPLVATPRFFKFESLKGFVLRVSETNGYDTPAVMLGGAGMTQGEMHSIIPPLEKLSPLFNRTTTEMSRLGYHKPLGSASARKIWLHNNQIPTIQLNIKSPKICTQCILETGFADSFWDLKFAIGCPIHNKYLLKRCPDCKKQLTWFRPGLLRCKCGCDLSKHSGESVNNEAVLGLLTFLRNLLRRNPHNQNYFMQTLGFPVDHLMNLTLPELLSIIVRFENKGGHLNQTIFTNPEFQEEITLQRVSHALKNWPEGLYSYLDSFNHDRASTKGFGLRKQFESFYGGLFKSDIPKEKIAFIRDAFVKYGQERWKQGFITKELDDNSGQGKRLVGIYGLAINLGVMPSTARRMVNKDLIPSITVTYNDTSRQLIDLTQPLPFKASTGKTFTVRKAAAWLGLPVNVLKALRATGDFPVQHIAKPMSAYHELDLMNFREKLLARCKKKSDETLNDYITFEQVMLMKVSAELKAAFIGAILQEDIASCMGIDKSIKAILFDRSNLTKLIEKIKIETTGLVTVVTAAKQLHCDPKVVKNLHQDGVLKGAIKPRGLFILQDSLNQFSKDYISCAALASLQNSSSSKIVGCCNRNSIEVHYFARAPGQNPQPFLKRNLVNLVL